MRSGLYKTFGLRSNEPYKAYLGRDDGAIEGTSKQVLIEIRASEQNEQSKLNSELSELLHFSRSFFLCLDEWKCVFFLEDHSIVFLHHWGQGEKLLSLSFTPSSLSFSQSLLFYALLAYSM